MLGPVTGRMERLYRDRADGDLVPVRQCVRVGTRRRRPRAPTPVARTPSARRPWPERWSACVCVSSTRVIARPRATASSWKGLHRIRGIDEHGLARLLVTDQVRRAAEVVVDELAQIHRAGTYQRLPLHFLKSELGPVRTRPGPVPGHVPEVCQFCANPSTVGIGRGQLGQAEVLGDDHALYLVRALADLEDLLVAVEP